MSVVNSTKLDPALNFRQLDSSKSSPMYRKVYPANGGVRNFILPYSGAIQPAVFNIPVEVVNMGESYLEYDYKIPAQGGATYIWMYRDVHGEFDSVLYRDTASQNIVDCKNCHIYQQITNRLNVSDQKLKHNDVLHGLYPTNALLSDVKSVRADGTACSLAFVEPVTIENITSGAAGVSDSNLIRKRIYLKDLIPDSYFGLAKNQLLPVETYLEINFSNAQGRIGFTSLSAVNPSSTPAAFTVEQTAGTNGITGLCLNLCVEQNQDLVKAMKMEVAKGMVLPLPVIKLHSLSVGATTGSYTYNLPIDNKQHGRKIKRIIYAPLYSAPAVNQNYNHSNIGGSKIVSYQTELDNAKLQRDTLEVKNYQDYMNNRPLLKGSCIYNQAIYNQNWVHVDSWSYDDKHSEQVGGGAIMTDGLVLNKPMTYTFNAIESNNGSIWSNTAIVCGLKDLVISATSFLVQ